MHRLQPRFEAVEQRLHTVERRLRWWRSLGGPMTRVAVGLLAVVVFLAGLLLAAPAGAQPPPPVPITQEPVMLPGPVFPGTFCADFDVLITFPVFNQRIIQQTSSDGTTTLRITGHATATVTNLDTGEFVTFNISGPGTLVFNQDRSFSADLAGPNLLFTARENLPEPNVLDVPTVSYTTGHVTFEVDAFGQTTSYTLAGGARQTDVCAVLAP